jgi:hypothetical protein
MGAQIGFMLHQYERKYHERAIDTYVAEPFRGVDWQIQQMQSFDGGTLGSLEEWQLVTRRLQAIPEYLERARTNLLAGKAAGNLPDHRMIQRDGIGGSESNDSYFRKTLVDLAQGYLGARPFAPSALGALRTAGAAAADAYTGFANFLRDSYDANDSVDRFAAGEEEYQWRLSNNLQVRKTPPSCSITAPSRWPCTRARCSKWRRRWPGSPSSISPSRPTPTGAPRSAR